MSASSRNDLTQGVVWKKLLGFFFPILLGMLFQQLYNTVDAIVVGRYLGDSALAAVGGSSSVITATIIGFFTGLNSGATVLISQHFGANDRSGLSRVLHTAILFCLAVGLIVTVLGITLARPALAAIGNPEDIMDPSVQYLRIYFAGAVPLLLYNLFQGTLQAVGDSRRPLFYLAVSCVLNIFLDVLFVAKLSLGVAGVGYASVISMFVCTVMAVMHLSRIDGPHRISFAALRPDRKKLRDMMRIGLPAGLQGMMYNVSNLVITAAVNSFGTGVVAAWTATGRLDGLYWVTSNSFGVAICAFVGQCYGAGKITRMKKAIRVCMGISITVTVILSVLLLTIARPAYALFLQDQEVIDTAIRIMWYFVPFYFTWTYVEVLSGTFRGVGDTLRPMIVVMLFSCVFRIIWMYTVVPHWHDIGTVSIVYIISWVLIGIVYTFYYFKGGWLGSSMRIADRE